MLLVPFGNKIQSQMRSPSKRVFDNLGPNKIRNSYTPSRLGPSRRPADSFGLTDPATGTLLPKPQEMYLILPQLQEAYCRLLYNNEIQVLAFDQIGDSKIRMDEVLKIIKKSNTDTKFGLCLKHPTEALNLFCEKEREMLCVICAHGDSTHKDKTHNIVPLEKAKRVLELDAERIKEKVKLVADKLSDWHYKLESKLDDLSDTFKTISNVTDHLISIVLDEVRRIGEEFARNLQRDKSRAEKVLQSFAGSIEDINKIYSRYLEEARSLSITEQLNILKVADGQLHIGEKVIRRMYETTTTLLPRWTELQTAVLRMKERKNVEVKERKEREIVITKF